MRHGRGGGVSPTLNAFDNATETRATVVVAQYWDGGQVADTLDSSMLSKQQAMPDKRRFPAVITPAEPIYSFKPGQSEAAGGPFITEGVVPTLQAQNNGSTAVPAVSVSAATNATSVVRRLTPVECERLQGFPDNWTEGLADTHRYKQMGNAVTVNVAHYLGWLLADA